MHTTKSILNKETFKHMSSIREIDNLPLGELAEIIQREVNEVKTNLEAILSTDAIHAFSDFYWKVLLFAQRVKNEL